MATATNATVQDTGVSEFLRDLRNANLAAFRDRLRAARKDGELPDDAGPDALAGFFATVIQGMSQRARDGANATELAQVAELAMTSWPKRPH